MKLRILHCLRAPVGGLFRHVRDLAGEQAAQGHDVGLLCDATAGDALTARHLETLAPYLSLGISRVPMPREIAPGDITATSATRRLASAMRVNVLHGHGAKGGAYARLAASAMRRRGLVVHAFYTPHGGSLHYAPSSLKGRLFMALERRLERQTDGLLLESAYAAAVFAAHVGQPACPVRIVHNGIASDDLQPVTAVADAADFVFVGELRQLKGVDLLIEAAARINAERQGACRVVIVGAGPDGYRFRADVAARGLADKITFPGAMPARQAFTLGRVLVMPSRAESLPYVALEAAGAGLPLIATRVGGVPEIVDGTDTPLVAPDDANGLAEAMQAALDAPALAAARAGRLHRRVAERFSVAAMSAGVLDLYAEGRRGTAATSPADRPALA